MPRGRSWRKLPFAGICSWPERACHTCGLRSPLYQFQLSKRGFKALTGPLLFSVRCLQLVRSAA
jgi:hypothetical protein